MSPGRSLSRVALSSVGAVCRFRIDANVTRIERYILRLFSQTYVLIFTSIAAIFVVFHVFSNIEDLNDLAEQNNASMMMTMLECYSPYILLVFDMTGAVLALMAFLFTVGWLHKTREITALLAAGVSHGQILRPIMVGGLAVLLLQMANREMVLPHVRDSLNLKNRHLSGDAPAPVLPSYDELAGILVDGAEVLPRSRVVNRPDFQLEGDYGAFGELLQAEVARWEPVNQDHESGYLLKNVSVPKKIDRLPSASMAGRTVLMTSVDQDWIAPGDCFVVTPIDPEILQATQSTTKISGSWLLGKRLSNPAVHSPASTHLMFHERLIRVPVDFALFLLGIPLAVNRRNRQMMMTIGAALCLVLAFFVLKTVATGLGGSGLWVSPAFAAWIPLLAFGPLTYMWFRESYAL